MKKMCLAPAVLLSIAGIAFSADEPQADRGREVYQRWCAPCHGDGLGKPGTSAAAAHGVRPALLEQRTDLTAKTIETAVRNGLRFMPRFRKTEISNADLAAITAYLVRK
jgi:(+)-pinoresinol hydroxylase